jgi:hypothetical protein
MWPRVVEVMFGVWLLLSPFIFSYSTESRLEFAWISDFLSGLLIIAFGLASYSARFWWAHFLSCLVAAYMISVGYFALDGIYVPAAQNHILIGMLVLMFAVLPNHTNDKPEKWQKFNGKSLSA